MIDGRIVKRKFFIKAAVKSLIAIVLIGMFIYNNLPFYFPRTDEISEDAFGARPSDADVLEPININTASVRRLQKLHGIGETKAQAIIDYREEHGDFTSVEELMNVKGIGEAVFAGIKDYITI